MKLAGVFILSLWYSLVDQTLASNDEKSNYLLSVGDIGARRLEVMDRLIGAHTRDAIKRVVQSKERIRIADIGAGDGSVSSFIASECGDECLPISLFDQSTKQLETAKEKLGEKALYIRLDILNSEAVTEYTGQFDVIHVRCLLMHLANPQQALQNLINMLADGGYLILQEPITSSAWANQHSEIFEAMNQALLVIGKFNGGDWDIGSSLETMIEDFKEVSITASWNSNSTANAKETKDLLGLGIKELEVPATNIANIDIEEVEKWYRTVMSLDQDSAFEYHLPTQSHLILKKNNTKF